MWSHRKHKFIQNYRKHNSEHVKLKRNILWDIIELDWEEDNTTLNGNKIHLPISVIILLRDKFKIRHIVKSEPLLFSYYAKARHDMV